MHRLFPDLDTAEIRACELAEHLVVIAGDIDDVRAALGALHDAADDRIVPLGPVKALLQSPAVDDVADQVEDIAVDVIEEIEQQPVVASSRAEVDVGNPDRSIPTPGATRWPHEIGRASCRERGCQYG